jgi:DNA polymerase-3 subunit alpha
MDSLALTDHGNLHGAVEFYKECRKQDVNPIIGYEAYVVGDRRDSDDSNYHLTILAKNRVGYKNLIRLSSLAFLDGFYRKPRVDYDALQSHAEGLIVLSGCMGSKFASLVGDKAEQDALSYLHRMQAMFPDFYVEIQRNGQRQQEYITECTIDFATRHGLPMVATGDLHYVDQEDNEVQDVLMCVATGSRRSQADRFQLDGDQYFLRTQGQMEALFGDQLEAVHRSAQIAARVDLELDLGTRRFPVYQHEDGGPERRDNSVLLEDLVVQGLEKRIPGAGPIYADRIQRELSVINELGFVDYFLIVHDFVDWAVDRGILSTARGSGVGSLVCYCLSISHVDPIKYDLLFERFLDLSRREAPDIDIDFDKERRAEVMMYVKEKYGHDSVAQIGTFGRMGAKQAIKDVARVEGFPLADAIELSDKVSEMPDTTLDDTDFGDLEPAAQAIIDMAKRCEGTARQLGTHAAAVVIAPGDLQDYVPLARLPGKSEVITQWDMHAVEDAGLLKMDFLGLRNLTILYEAIAAIEASTGKAVDIHRIPFDDPDAWGVLSRGETMGLFQLESPGMSDLLIRMKPDNIEHLIATIALYRPGPLDAGMVDEYIAVKNGRKNASYPHPSVESILGVTYGVMVYQEQVMQVVHRLGGIPLDEAYSCVKAISKKLPDKMALYRDRFVEGCESYGVDGPALWDQIKTFARYGFNRSHSAAYAFLSYQTAWLKAHYPAEFMAAILNSDIPDRNFKRKDRLIKHLEDCKRLGIRVSSPNINTCYSKFRVEGGQILFGLSAIKGVSRDNGDHIVRLRADRPFRHIHNFCRRVSKAECPEATLRNLIEVGACDEWVGNRNQNTELIKRAVKIAEGGYKSRRGRRNGRKYKRDLVVDQSDELAAERKWLGFYLSGHPCDMHADIFHQTTTVMPIDIKDTPGETFVTTGGMVGSIRHGVTKNNKPYIGFKIETGSGECDAVMWSSEVKKYGKLIKDGEILLFRGRVDERKYKSLTVKKVCEVDNCSWSAGIVLVAAEPEQLDACSEILCAAPGETQVYGKVCGATLTFDRGVRVTSGLLEKLGEHCEVRKVIR